MEQNSDKWLEWRRQGLGASDAPVIMEVSPWNTPRGLFKDKLGLTKSVGNFATQRGHDLEPKARASFELEIGEEFEAKLAVHSEYTWLRASLDGYNEKLNAILEIKCPGKEDHATAKAGKVPEKYIPQLQHQLLVTGAAICYYYSFDGESGVTVEVRPDKEYIEAKLFPKLAEFWECVRSKNEPPLTKKDQVVVEDKETLALADQYALLDDQAKALKEAMDAIKVEIVKKITHPKAKVGRLTVTKSITKGNVDYAKVPELKGVVVDDYRKASYEKVSIRVNKK